MEQKEWFESWFNQPIYHLLYQHHDDREAHAFIDCLLNTLRLPDNAAVLDLACGKGRHSKYLADLGFDVTGIDLSPENIEEARKMEREGLAFFQADMRHMFRVNYFEAVFNFFTSFGYFDTDREHAKVLLQTALNLKMGAYFVLDYLNTNYVEAHLVKSELKQIGNIEFDIHRSFEDGFFYKAITINEEGKKKHFVERVRGFRLEDFQRLFTQSGLSITHIYGGYQLQDYDPQLSERLIVIAQRIK
ncbi:MAG: class I SAM-dependent methyltransferase [Saprospiraceae bacterium]